MYINIYKTQPYEKLGLYLHGFNSGSSKTAHWYCVDISEDRGACYRTCTQTDLLLFIVIEVYMLADTYTLLCSSFHSKKFIHLLYNRFGSRGFPTSGSPSTCVVLFYMKDVEDKIISQVTHEERSCNTLDIQEKREEDVYLATQSQAIKRPTSTEEQAMALVKVSVTDK